MANSTIRRFCRGAAVSAICFLQAAFVPDLSGVTINWSMVGNAGNLSDPATGSKFGAVAYSYSIGTYDVTNSQYAEFLNTKDPGGSNLLGLWNNGMADTTFGGITFNNGNLPGSKYVLTAGREIHPVNFVTWPDAMRFANWLNNGQGNGDTESGAYTLLGGTPSPSNVNSVVRNTGATVFLPSQDEWYKAAYYNSGNSSYFNYPTSSNSPPTGTGPTAAPNSANYNSTNLTNVGAYTGTTSPYGAFDMGGDVEQLDETVDIADGPSVRFFRGGAFDANNPGILSAQSYGAVSPTNVYADLGFRVASLPAPPAWGIATGGKWNVAGNWSTNSVPDSNTTVVNMHDKLTTVTAGGNIIDLEGANRTVKQMDFQTTNAGVSYNVSNGTVTLGDAANTGAITVGAANLNDQTISAGLIYANAATKITNASSKVLNLAGVQNWSGHGVTIVAGTVSFNSSANATNTSGAILTINNGATVGLAGPHSATSDGTHYVSINNAGALNASGTNQRVGSIDGTGNTQVNAGVQLTANHIIQNTLIIGGSAGSHGTVTIDASDASGNPLGEAASPEFGVVGSIDGAGNTQLSAGAQLMANHVIQNALIIGGTAGSRGTATIDASDVSGNLLGEAASPGFGVSGSLAPGELLGLGGAGSMDLSNAFGGGSDLALLSAGENRIGGAQSSIPEPSAVVLALLAFAALSAKAFSAKQTGRTMNTNTKLRQD